MPHESSEDSSNQPDGPMGSPRCPLDPLGPPGPPQSTRNRPPGTFYQCPPHLADLSSTSLVLLNLAHSYFLVASRNLSFVRPLVLHCGTLGKLTDKAGHDIPSSVQGKRFVAFQVSCLLALLPNARTSLQATWVQKSKMESSKQKSKLVNRCQKIQVWLNVTKCFQNQKLLNSQLNCR